MSSMQLSRAAANAHAGHANRVVTHLPCEDNNKILEQQWCKVTAHCGEHILRFCDSNGRRRGLPLYPSVIF